MTATVPKRSAPRRTRGGRAGFTLIEIVVAVSLLGGVMLVLLETHYRTLQLFDSAREHVLVRNFLSQAVGRAETEVLAGNLAGNGDFGKRYPDYAYSFEAQQTGQGFVLLYDVLVTVTDPEGESHEIVFMVYDPRSDGVGVAAPGGASRAGPLGGGTAPGGLSGIGSNLDSLPSGISGLGSLPRR